MRYLSLTLKTIIILHMSVLIATAQEFISLEKATKSGANPLYVLERCSSLNFSILKWAGEAQLNRDGVDVFTKMSEEFFAMKTMALAFYKKKGLSESDAVEALNRNTKKIEEIYIARFKENYANTGQAFGNDTVVMSDRKFCERYVLLSYDYVDGLFGKNWRDMLFD